MPSRPCHSKRTTPLLAASLLALLAGCASSPVEHALEEERAVQARAAERATVQQSNKQTVIDTLPDWIIDKPSPDETGVYGAGIGTSHNLSLALQKANIDARRDMAQVIQQELSAEATLAGPGDNAFQSIVNTFIDRVNVAGARDVDREIQAGRDGYRVYVLLKLPYPEFNQAMSAMTVNDDPAGATFQEQYDRLRERASEAPAYEPESPGSTSDTGGQAERIGEDMPDEALVRALQASAGG